MKYRNVSVKSLPSYIKKKFILLVVPYVVWYVLVPKYVSNVSLATMLNPLTIIKPFIFYHNNISLLYDS